MGFSSAGKINSIHRKLIWLWFLREIACWLPWKNATEIFMLGTKVWFLYSEGFLLCKSLWIIISAGILEHVNYRPKLINVMHTEHSSGAFGQGFSKPINVEHSNRDQRAFHNRQLGLVNTAIDGKIADHSYLKQSDRPSSVIVSSRSSH